MKQKQVDDLNNDLYLLAGKRPFDSLTEEEKTDMIRKWAVLKAEKMAEKTLFDKIANSLVGVFVISISLFGIAWALKMLFTTLGVI